MQTLLLAVVATLFLASVAAADEPIVTEWRDLWNRCRIAAETGQRPDVSGLDNLGFSYRLVPPTLHPDLGPFSPSFGRFVPEQRWGLRSGRFVIAETEISQGPSKFLPNCKIDLADEASPITKNEELLLAEAFRADRSRLIATNRYELRDPVAISTTTLGLRRTEPTANGCAAVSTLAIANSESTEPFLSAFNLEFGFDCGGSSSRFPWPGQSPLFPGNSEALVHEIEQVAGTAGTEGPLNALLLRCRQEARVVCVFGANDGGIMGVTQSADNTSAVLSLIVQIPSGNQQVRTLIATVAATMKVLAKEASPEQRRDGLAEIDDAVRDGKQHVQVEIDGVFWILENSPVAINVGVIRK
jgi:hypothetical protein